MIPIRIRNYRNYLNDGKSWTEIKCSDNALVMVALIVGTEPRFIHDETDFMDIDSVILRAAKNIQKERRKEKKAKS